MKWRSSVEIKRFSKPKISYAFFCYNMIERTGLDFVRKTFSNLQHQSDDIMVMDSSSNKKEFIQLLDLCDEFGFKYIDVKTDKNKPYQMAKVSNKAVIEAKYDIFVRLSPDILYPFNLSYYIESFFRKHDIKNSFLKIKMFDVESGRVFGREGHEKVYYKPFLLKCRGWDERTFWYGWEDMYMTLIMEFVFSMKQHVPHNYFILHKKHPKYQKSHTKLEKEKQISFNVFKQLNLLKRDLETNKKLVVNSYW